MSGSVNSLEHCGTTTEHENDYKSHMVVNANCHASMRGMFLGLALIVITAVFIILFHVATNNEYVILNIPKYLTK